MTEYFKLNKHQVKATTIINNILSKYEDATIYLCVNNGNEFAYKYEINNKNLWITFRKRTHLSIYYGKTNKTENYDGHNLAQIMQNILDYFGKK